MLELWEQSEQLKRGARIDSLPPEGGQSGAHTAHQPRDGRWCGALKYSPKGCSSPFLARTLILTHLLLAKKAAQQSRDAETHVDSSLRGPKMGI